MNYGKERWVVPDRSASTTHVQIIILFYVLLHGISNMPTKRAALSAESSSLTPPPTKLAKRKAIAEASDEFQQVTLPTIVDRYRVEGLVGGDVYYQPDVSDRR